MDICPRYRGNGRRSAGNRLESLGIKVGGAVKVTAEVVAIDRVDRIVALLGPRGNVVEV